MSTEELKLAASRVALGLLRPEDLARVGLCVLERGCDTPSLRILAGLTESEADDARRVFDRVLSELDVEMPGRRDAVMHLAREIAKEILAGTMEAYLGAKEIWEITLRATDEDFPELDTFVYAASEWEDRPEDRKVFAEGIVAAARDLVKSGGLTTHPSP